jgi:hypothetical protein
VSFEKDPQLANHVLNRIATQKTTLRRTGRREALRWVAGVAAVAALVAAAFMVSQQLERQRALREGSYLMMIDPVTRAHSEAARDLDKTADSLIDRLAWMQQRLDLSQEQFLQLVDLHKAYSDRFDFLYEELVQLQKQYEAFEELRLNNEMIDFIALYEVLSERKEAESSALALSQELISRVTAILRPDQRAAYLGLVRHSNNTPDA